MILAMGGEALRTYYYYCSVHDHLFKACRTKADLDVDPEKALRSGIMAILYKFPAREWTKGYPAEITCPEGNSDPKTLNHSRPGAEERQ